MRFNDSVKSGEGEGGIDAASREFPPEFYLPRNRRLKSKQLVQQTL